MVYLEKMFWAKSNPYKPLVSHLLEASAVANVLLSDSIFKPLFVELRNNVSFSQQELLNFVSYLSGIHDIGKIHPAFVGNGVMPGFKEILVDNDLFWGVNDNFRHEVFGAERLKEIWKDKKRVGSLDFREAFSSVIYYHHQGKQSGFSGLLSGKYQKAWYPFHELYENRLYQRFPFPSLFSCKNLDAFCMLLLGVVIISDWIASGDTFEGISYDGMSDDDIVNNAVILTRKFFNDNGLGYIEPFGHIQSFSDLWEFIPYDAMRPLQVKAEEIVSAENKPLAVIVEAPMGEGKTEAGLYIASRLAQYWGKDGLYVALPTSATSNQMYSRVNAMLKHLNLGRAKLMHAMAWMADSFSANGFGSSSEEVKCWTAPMRRGLLAPFAVGTIDQVMMAVMTVKFGVLRLAGLTNKVLVIDELHSYDAYMSEIIESLLRWCKVLHIPVVMLSATLPVSKKKSFASCYFGKLKDYGMVSNLYPSYSLLYEDKKMELLPAGSSTMVRDVKLSMEPCLGCMDGILSLVNSYFNRYDGCICVLCNTVKSSQEIFKLLRDNLSGIPVMLFHARFFAERRQELETDCIKYFGKDKKNRPVRMVLVATQVVEQSLDLDFDYMISEVCPVDLLLQRMGRLWRHSDTVRPDGLEPGITVLVPPVPGHYGAIKHVYHESILNRTIVSLIDYPVVSVPSDIPVLVDKVYGVLPADFCDSLDGWTEENLVAGWMDYQIEEGLKKSSARDGHFGRPQRGKFYFSEIRGILGSDDASSFFSAKTRLGEASVRIAMVPRELFLEVQNMPVSSSVAKKVLLRSVSVSARKLSFLKYVEKYPAKVFLGTCLLWGTYVLCADDDSFCIGNQEICMDRELGLLI